MKNVKPVLILACICIAVTTALALTNQATAPIIAAAAQEAAIAARTELLPDATGFEEIKTEVVNVSDIYATTNNVGTIVTATAKGYSSTLIIMVAFNPDGTMKQVKVQDQNETAGIGTKILDCALLTDNYVGLPAEEIVLDGGVISRISGATISSKALNAAVNSAIEAYNAIGG